ncbi:hypothetical protein CPC08DRAFT_226982 [Agrocybe pediades]|nr:hypothetical protein CPC08DRAFT_226982 [Agrocybe pediades]
MLLRACSTISIRIIHAQTGGRRAWCWMDQSTAVVNSRDGEAAAGINGYLLHLFNALGNNERNMRCLCSRKKWASGQGWCLWLSSVVAVAACLQIHLPANTTTTTTCGCHSPSRTMLIDGGVHEHDGQRGSEGEMMARLIWRKDRGLCI